MFSITRLRQSYQALAARLFGTRYHSPRLLARQRRAEGHYSEVKSLPMSTIDPVVILDTSSVNFGFFVFMAGFDPAGGPSPVGGP